MTLNYTPGPWYVANNSNDSQGLVISETTGQNIAVSYDVKDATLIAAAPELLEALMRIANDWPHETPALPAEHVRKIARRAIQKAKGE